MSNKIALVVVVFGKRLDESETIKSLLSFDKAIDSLLIVNNGPIGIDEDDTILSKLEKIHHKVALENQIQNKPLSWIYNDFVEKNEADYYVFFDDDTEINIEYQNMMFTMHGVDVELPKIISIYDKIQYYPLVDGVVKKDDGEIFYAREIFSIGSGLIMSKKVKKIFSQKNIELFDSNFALYGVDFSFFRKINHINKCNMFLKIFSNSYINHSLSRVEKKISVWRERERLYDAVLTLKYYYSYPALRIFKLILMKIISGKMYDIKAILSVAFNGSHPRCKK